MEGSIPACLVQSEAIQELYLSNNHLTGTLPQPPATSKLLIISADSMVRGAAGCRCCRCPYMVDLFALPAASGGAGRVQ